MLNHISILTPIDAKMLKNIYARLMVGEESKEVIEPPFTRTCYLPIKNITNSLFLIFCQKKEQEVSYLDKMVGSLELKLDPFLDQRKHRVKHNVQLSSDLASLTK